MSEWISVSDRLPRSIKPCHVQIIIHRECGHISGALYNTLTHFFQLYNFETLDDVTHWQLLPEPPK